MRSRKTLGATIGTIGVASLAAAYVVTQGSARTNPADLASGAVAEVTDDAPLIGARTSALGELLRTWAPEPTAVPR